MHFIKCWRCEQEITWNYVPPEFCPYCLTAVEDSMKQEQIDEEVKEFNDNY